MIKEVSRFPTQRSQRKWKRNRIKNIDDLIDRLEGFFWTNLWLSNKPITTLNLSINRFYLRKSCNILDSISPSATTRIPRTFDSPSWCSWSSWRQIDEHSYSRWTAAGNLTSCQLLMPVELLLVTWLLGYTLQWRTCIPASRILIIVGFGIHTFPDKIYLHLWFWSIWKGNRWFCSDHNQPHSSIG